MSKNILCFGDSNTFGYIAGSGQRFSSGVRWTSVLAELLQEHYKIFEGGCNNRACFVNHNDGDKFIGKKFITKYLPYNIDIIISLIGSNDIQKFYKPTTEELEKGFNEYIKIIKNNFQAEIIVLAPPIITEKVLSSNFNYFFDEVSVEQSKLLAPLWQKIANNNDCKFINLNDKINVSTIDGLHFDEKSHKIIAQELATYILKNNL